MIELIQQKQMMFLWFSMAGWIQRAILQVPCHLKKKGGGGEKKKKRSVNNTEQEEIILQFKQALGVITLGAHLSLQLPAIRV